MVCSQISRWKVNIMNAKLKDQALNETICHAIGNNFSKNVETNEENL